MIPLLKCLKDGVQNEAGNFKSEYEQAVRFLISPVCFSVPEFVLTFKYMYVLFSLGTLLTTHSPTPVAPHPVTMPTYRAPGTPTYSYVPPQW